MVVMVTIVGEGGSGNSIGVCSVKNNGGVKKTVMLDLGQICKTPFP
jgi:hypothetical protein